LFSALTEEKLFIEILIVPILLRCCLASVNMKWTEKSICALWVWIRSVPKYQQGLNRSVCYSQGCSAEKRCGWKRP